MKHKINKKLLLKEVGFTWHNRYSSNESTDDMGRWARLAYYNGFSIAWVNGFVKQDTMPIIDHRRTGVCNSFLVSLQFPTTSNQSDGYEKFTNIEDAKKYVTDMFNDFKKLIN